MVELATRHCSPWALQAFFSLPVRGQTDNHHSHYVTCYPLRSLLSTPNNHQWLPFLVLTHKFFEELTHRTDSPVSPSPLYHTLPPLTSIHITSPPAILFPLPLPPSLPPPQSSPGAPYTCIYQEQEEQGSTTRVEGTVMSSSEVNGLDKIVIRCASREVRHMTHDI